MIRPEELVGEEWAAWYRLSPAERWLESEKLRAAFLTLRGSHDPEPVRIAFLQSGRTALTPF